MCEREKEKRSVFTPNGENLETASLHGSVYYLESGCMTLFCHIWSPFALYWVGLFPGPILFTHSLALWVPLGRFNQKETTPNFFFFFSFFFLGKLFSM